MDQPGPVLEAETQRVEHAVDVALRAGAALNGQPRRLVEGDHMIVAMDHQGLDLGSVAVGHRRPFPRLGRRGRGDAGRQAHLLARLDTVVALRPLAVDADLAGAQEFLQGAMAQRRVVALEPAVQPKPGIVVGDGAGLDLATQGAGDAFGAGLSIMARNLRDKLKRVHEIGVVRHIDVRPSRGLPTGPNVRRDLRLPTARWAALSVHGDPDEQRRRAAAPRALLCTGSHPRGRCRADRRQLRGARRAPHRGRPDAGLRRPDGRRRLRRPRPSARRSADRPAADRE